MPADVMQTEGMTEELLSSCSGQLFLGTADVLEELFEPCRRSGIRRDYEMMV